MASISREKNGRRTIQFIGADGKRRSVRLGKVSQRHAEAIKLKVEQLAAAALSRHAIDAETARWVAKLDTDMSDKLAAVGLIPKKENATLQAFVDSYIASRTDVKERTHDLYEQTRRSLLEFFAPGKPLTNITPGDADEWRLFMLGTGLGDNTVRRRCGRAKQFCRAAVRKGLIASNPFADLKSAVRANPEKFHFVPRNHAERILDACPDAEWRLIFALSRFGGLRCPSEHLALGWTVIDWAHDRMTVRSPKTEHHPGGESRVVPIFPELRPYLAEVFELAEPGTEHVITRYRDSNSNLRTQLNRIIRRAGLEPWVKPFQNLRSTRETELAEEYPMHVVCAWIGNSQPVAAKHYLQVTDEHFAKAVQNPVQQPAVSPRTEPQSDWAAHNKTPVLQGCATTCDSMQTCIVPPQGLEP